jgi:hypothetical protein
LSRVPRWRIRSERTEGVVLCAGDCFARPAVVPTDRGQVHRDREGPEMALALPRPNSAYVIKADTKPMAPFESLAPAKEDRERERGREREGERERERERGERERGEREGNVKGET